MHIPAERNLKTGGRRASCHAALLANAVLPRQAGWASVWDDKREKQCCAPEKCLELHSASKAPLGAIQMAKAAKSSPGDGFLLLLTASGDQGRTQSCSSCQVALSVPSLILLLLL